MASLPFSSFVRTARKFDAGDQSRPLSHRKPPKRMLLALPVTLSTILKPTSGCQAIAILLPSGDQHGKPPPAISRDDPPSRGIRNTPTCRGSGSNREAASSEPSGDHLGYRIMEALEIAMAWPPFISSNISLCSCPSLPVI